MSNTAALSGRMDQPLPPRAEPTVLRTVPPLTRPDRSLEQALRLQLFPVQVNDGQGHGPDPGSQEWQQARRTLIKRRCEQAGPLRYVWSRVDLNDDGAPEVVATVLGSSFCGTGGCELLIFQQRQGRLEPVTAMGLFKEPLIVSDQKTNGWRNLISRVRWDAGRSTYALLPFDGRSYPTNPSGPPARPLQGTERGIAYLSWDPSGKAQHPLACEAGTANP
jgi:hypothetical protein